jgi:hypothetical protein
MCKGSFNYHSSLRPFSTGILALAVFQCVLIFLNIMIFCFHPRDDSTRMVEKAGTVSYGR